MSIQYYVTRFALFVFFFVYISHKFLHHRLVKFTCMSGEALLLSMIYLNRISSKFSNFPINIFTIHRLLLTWYVFCVMLFYCLFFNYVYLSLACCVQRNLSTIDQRVTVDFQKSEVYSMLR